MLKELNKRDALPANYHFYQTKGETTWIHASRDKLAQLLDSHPPEFITVLGVSKPYDGDREEETRYLGPMYFDLDGSLDEVIPQFHKLLLKLVDESHLNLSQVRMYATGGRGFHLELPQSIFMPAVPEDGVRHLPRIYREMALELIVDTMDMAVYSGKRGRQWRVPNRQRPNGRFKVPITLEEALSITPETYSQLCSSPRPWPPLQPPELNSGLALLFSICQRKVLQTISRQSKANKIDAEMLRRFGGKFPPCMRPLMEGKIQSPQGFNRVALQLAATAHALGVGEDELVNQCAGLIRSHQSDGNRYDTPAKREAELRGQFKYTRNSPYPASVGGIRSILPGGFPTRDLMGIGARP